MSRTDSDPAHSAALGADGPPQQVIQSNSGDLPSPSYSTVRSTRDATRFSKAAAESSAVARQPLPQQRELPLAVPLRVDVVLFDRKLSAGLDMRGTPEQRPQLSCRDRPSILEGNPARCFRAAVGWSLRGVRGLARHRGLLVRSSRFLSLGRQLGRLGDLLGCLSDRRFPEIAAFCPLCERWAVLDLKRPDPLRRAGLCLRRSQTAVRLLRESGQLRPPTMKPGTGDRA